MADTYDGTTGAGWGSLGGGLLDSPSVNQDPSTGRITVYGNGGAGAGGVLYSKTYSNGAWGAWTSLGGPNSGVFKGAPSSVMAPNGTDYVFVRGTDNQLWQNILTGTTGGGWGSLGGSLTDSPDATALASGLTPS